MSYLGSPGGVGGYTGKGSGPRAGFWRRFAAYVVDWVILTLVNVILIALLKSAGTFISLAIGIVYFTVLDGGPRGQTLGKQALGIRVISLDDGGPIGYGRGFIRYIGLIISVLVIFIGVLWMLWDKESQGWQDKLAGDVVVPVSAYPLP